MPISAKDWVRATRAELLLGDPSMNFTGISIDTRTLQPGQLFCAIPGPRHDGHDHLETALHRGAVGLVIQTSDERLKFDREAVPTVFRVPHTIQAIQAWSRFVRDKSQATFVGITGSNGKTTTKEMTAAILSRMGKTLATRGNLNNHLGLPLTLSQLQFDERYVILEMGTSRPGDIALLAEIGRPQVAVITNIGKAHLEGLGSQQGILKEKWAIFEALGSTGLAVVNQDDPLIAAAASRLACRKLFYGTTALADVRAEDIYDEASGVRFVLNVRGQKITVRLPVPGQFQVMNALAAAALADGLGVPIDEIAAGLAGFQPAAMRMQILPHPSGAVLINDAYNANPSSVRMSITGLCTAYSGRKRWLVLGDMRELGTNSRTEHLELGRWLAKQPLDRVYLYGRDTRFVVAGLKDAKATMDVKRFKKKKLLFAELRDATAEKPVILFKASRSMKLEQLISPLVGAVATAH
jgi:UDP-N-acetylmuramoyl-tripeptide--D-alanyl-D-alanine ligase